MTNQEVQNLFTSHPFAEAKRLLIEECERNGHELMGHETIFELRALATQGGSSFMRGGVTTGTVATSGSGEPDPEASEGCKGFAPTASAGGEPSSGESGAEGNAEPSSQGEHKDPNGCSENAVERQQEELNFGKEKSDNPDGEGNANEPKPEEGKPEETVPQKRPRKRKQVPESTAQTPDDKEKEAAKKIEEAKQLMKEAEEERERQRKLAQAQQEKQGKHHMTDEVVKRLKCLHKAFLVGPAGTGKSTLAMCACKELFGIEGTLQDVAKSDKFAQISFSPDTITADMLGFTDVNGVFHETDIVRVFRDGGVILFDEMDDADASLLVKLNTMLANGVIPTPNGMVVQNENTYIIGTANTYGTGGDSMYVGRSRLDAATLDRWKLATIMVDYDKKLEDSMCEGLDDKQKRELLTMRTVIRDSIECNKWKQICSTRFVTDGVKMARAGYSSMQILNTFLLSWSEQNAKSIKTAVKDAWINGLVNQ